MLLHLSPIGATAEPEIYCTQLRYSHVAGGAAAVAAAVHPLLPEGDKEFSEVGSAGDPQRGRPLPLRLTQGRREP